MSNEIIKVLDDLAARFGVAIDWTAENIMPYLTEIFKRHTTYEIIMCVVDILGATIFIVAGRFRLHA